MIKILVTNIEYYNKNYLILTNFKKSHLFDLVEIIGDSLGGYFDFLNVIVMPSASTFATQSTKSPRSNWSKSTIVSGIPTLREFPPAVPILLCFIIIISHTLYLITNIFNFRLLKFNHYNYLIKIFI